MDEATFRTYLRELKRRIHRDAELRAKFDFDGDGEISGEEWERAVAMLRQHLQGSERTPGEAAAATMNSLREPSAFATPPAPTQPPPSPTPVAGPAAPTGASLAAATALGVGSGEADATPSAPRPAAVDAVPTIPLATPEPTPSEPAAVRQPSPPAFEPTLVTTPSIIVRQKVEMREAMLGYETANSYDFIDGASGRSLGGADEERGSIGAFFLRQFLGPGRPLKLVLIDQNRSAALEGTRPFKLLAAISPPAMQLSDNGGPVGTIRRIWPLVIKRRYRLATVDGRELFIEGQLFKPWTFPVLKGGRQVALLQKKWSGIGREMFTDADSFRITFEDQMLPADERLLVVAAALAVDFDFFEQEPGD